MSEEKRVELSSPELEALRRIDKLTESPNAVLSDVNELEIVGIAALSALNAHVVEIPATMTFIKEITAWRASRGRMGRKELLAALSRPRYVTVMRPSPAPELPEEELVSERTRGLFSRIFKRR